jgi:hypothetical protein
MQARIAAGWLYALLWLSLPGWLRDEADGVWHGPVDALPLKP